MSLPRLEMLGLPLLVTALSAGCGDAAPVSAPPPPSGFRVQGGFVRDPEGRALLLRGMNLSGAHKQAPYFSFHQLPDYQRLRDAWGMNAIRFLISWAAVEPEKGVIDEAYLGEVKKRMDWARQAGLYVVLDMHQDVYGEGFAKGGGNGAPRWTCDEALYASFQPNPSQWFLNYLSPEVSGCYDHFWQTDELRAHYAEAWRRVAESLPGYDDVVLGFDPMNEPYWGTYAMLHFEADLLQPFHEQVIATVRKARPKWLAFTEPASSRNLGIPTGLTPFAADNIVYAPHAYDRDAESGKGFDPAHRAAVLQNLADLSTEAGALGAALWIGEYGGMAGSPGIVDYMDTDYTGIGAAAAGSTYWSYDRSGGYGVLTEEGAEKTELLTALVRPWPERVAGDPLSYAFDAATSTFTLRYHPDRALAAATVISVPARVYPDGYVVDCGGCAYERAEGTLTITSAPSADPAVVVLTPGKMP